MDGDGGFTALDHDTTAHSDEDSLLDGEDDQDFDDVRISASWLRDPEGSGHRRWPEPAGPHAATGHEGDRA